MGVSLTAPIVEVFSSIQGEGKTVGVPSTFVRFYGCNLRCTYCDTPYAVDKEKEKAETLTSFQVYRRIITANPTNVIFTGGEPMLYQKFIMEVMYKLNQKKNIYTCEIETNGTILPIDCFAKYVDVFNISPKLTNSGNRIQDCIKFDVLNSLYLPHKSILKFVVKKENDVKQAREIYNKYPKLVTYLMPEGDTRKKQAINTPKVIGLCLQYGLYFSPRLHILIWGSQRGK